MNAWTIQSVREAIAAKNVSARELTAEFYKRIHEHNPVLNAFLTLGPDRASAQAQRIDGLVAAKKPLPPLAGVPVAVKDVISTRGIRTTCGRSEEHTSELQSPCNLVCRLLLEKKKIKVTEVTRSDTRESLQ